MSGVGWVGVSWECADREEGWEDGVGEHNEASLLLEELHFEEGMSVGDVVEVDGASSGRSPDGEDGRDEFDSISANPRTLENINNHLL